MDKYFISLMLRMENNIISFLKFFRVDYVWRFFLRLIDMFKYIKVFRLKGFKIFFIIHNFKGGKVRILNIPGIKEKLYLRFNTSDRSVFKQIFIDKEYDYSINFEPKLILDLGSNNGYSAVYFKNKFPDSTIYSVEPDINNFNIFLKNTEKYKNIIGLNKGVWHKNTYLKIKNPDGGSQSFELEETDEVNGLESITIDSILKKSGFNKIDILKMDIEGSEKEVFSNHSDNWIQKTKFMFIETHDRKKEGTEKAVLDKAFKFGFSTDQIGENLVLKK